MKEQNLLNDLEKFKTLREIANLAISYDEKLLNFLLEESAFKEEFKERFFINVAGTLIFKQDEFKRFLDLKLLDKSFTAFSNKIGLGTKAKKFLKVSDEVVLNFPYKDCVLKGGQSKDEGKEEEILFNEVLAKSEIDVLFSPKILGNVQFLGDRRPPQQSAISNQQSAISNQQSAISNQQSAISAEFKF